ncbi:hypothetical protein [Variovorax gossypii]
MSLTILGFAASCIAFFPGFMSSDSFSQYASSQSLSYIDWHPPVMAWVWSILNFIFPGPEGLLYLHLLALWTGLYLWFFRYRDAKLGIAIILIGILPWVANFSGVLWKDVGLAFALLLFSVIANSPMTFGRFMVSLLLLFYAINVRHNAIFAAFPLVLYAFYHWRPGLRKIWILALTFVVLGAMLVLGNFLNYSVLHAKKMNPSNYMMLDDLSYLSLIEKRSLIPGIPIEDIRDCATQEVGQTRLIARDFCFSKKQSYHDHSPFRTTLASEWKGAIMNHPGEYIRFKLAAFAYFMRSSDSSSFYIWQEGIDPNGMGLIQNKNALTVALEHYVKNTSEFFPFLFKPYWWLWFSFALSILSLAIKRSRSTSAAQMLLASSIFYILGYLPAGPTADFRYVYWSVIATSLAAILIAIGGFRLPERKKPGVYVALFMGFTIVTVLLFNLQNIFKIDMDKAVLQSIS